MFRWLVLTVVLGSFLFPRATHAAVPTGPGLLARLNQARAEAGRPLLRDSYTLRRAAIGRANDMAYFGYFSHRSSTGSTYQTWLAAGPARFSKTGENIARGYPTSLGTIQGWLSSGGHRKNLLDSNFTHVGTAVRQITMNGRPAFMFVAIFGRSGR